MTQLETELRAALQARAARVHASQGLLAADYHPRTRRIRPPLAIGAGLAIVAAALAAVLSLVGGAGSAYAGWTARPTTPTRAQLAAAETYCADNVPFPGLPLKLTAPKVGGLPQSNPFCQPSLWNQAKLSAMSETLRIGFRAWAPVQTPVRSRSVLRRSISVCRFVCST